MHEVFEGGPADRAGVKKGDLIEEVDGVDTKGMELRDVVDRLRGDEGTDVTIKVRQPREAKSRTMKITRGQLPRTTIEGVRKRRIGRLEAPARRARSDRLPEDHRDHGQHAARAAQAGRSRWRARASAAWSSTSAVRRSVHVRCTRPSSWPTACSSAGRSGASGRPGARRPTRPTPTPCSAAGRSPCSSIRRHGGNGGMARGRPPGQPSGRSSSARRRPQATRPGSCRPPPRSRRRRHCQSRWLDARLSSRSTVPVGDGRSSISLVTGYLERGDGRPLANEAAGSRRPPRTAEQTRSGVQPDHVQLPAGSRAAAFQSEPQAGRRGRHVSEPSTPGRRSAAEMPP